MNGGRVFGGGARRKTDRRTLGGTVRRRVEECAGPGEGSVGGAAPGPQRRSVQRAVGEGRRPPKPRSPQERAPLEAPGGAAAAVPRPPTAPMACALTFWPQALSPSCPSTASFPFFEVQVDAGCSASSAEAAAGPGAP